VCEITNFFSEFFYSITAAPPIASLPMATLRWALCDCGCGNRALRPSKDLLLLVVLNSHFSLTFALPRVRRPVAWHAWFFFWFGFPHNSHFFNLFSFSLMLPKPEIFFTPPSHHTIQSITNNQSRTHKKKEEMRNRPRAMAVLTKRRSAGHRTPPCSACFAGDLACR
jgi:hypothetical protein